MKKITSTIRNYSLGFVLLGCIGSMSCTREADFDMEGTGTDGAAFSATIGQASRRGDNAWTGGELVGMKVGNETKTYFVSDATGAMGTDDEPYTWTAESGSYELHAWSPLTTENISLVDQSDADKMFACDLVDCKTTVNAQAVQLTFKHKMTRVWYELQHATDYTEDEKKNAIISYFGYANVKYTEGEIEKEGEPNAEISTRKIDDIRGEAFLVPGEMWDKPLIKVIIAGDTYIYTPKHSVQTDEERQTGVLKEGYNQRYYLKVSKKGLEVSMEDGPAWETVDETENVDNAMFKAVISTEITGLDEYEAEGFESGNTFITDATTGFSITYKENNASGGIEFEGLCDRERTVSKNEDGTVTFKFTNIRSDIKLKYTTEYMEVGYYLYNNGTYGEDYKEGSTAGVIFKVGQHETDNVANYDGKLTKIHGYAVALADEKNASQGTTFKWKEGNGTLHSNEYPEFGIGGGNTTQYMGYLNTKYLIEKVATLDNTTVPAASASTTKNTPSTITGTSGWYLPSHTQLKDLESLANFSHTNYTALSGTYWDSSFDGEANAYIVVFENGRINGTDFYRAVDSEQNVRLILTF